jgi:hypothetical protein
MMRFSETGPAIPDELLLARDQGRVVFFCGAGVSLAKAALPDFFGLAEQVINRLGVSDDSAAVKTLKKAKEVGDGLISADRVFGLLEREFLTRDIEKAVAETLKPKPAVDLTAHKNLMRLATTREGLVRLVTTNFDLLFDNCNSTTPSHQYPKLPFPLRPHEFSGIVYLHGKVTSKYDGAAGDGFVLSSSDFGRAYLSDGWATRFFKEIIERYVVIFVGYAADDPPVNYLLEALNKSADELKGVYAFQSGDSNFANSKWGHKGVEAICYDGANKHAALWDTLAAWAERADNPAAWIERVIQKAKNGPENLLPHERGQVAHVVSTAEGLRKFSDGDEPPPATWLRVFDPYQRYAKPGHEGGFENKGAYVDPFELYCLDSDPVPEKTDPEDQYAKRETPKDAWDAFAPNKLDRLNLRDESFSAVRGHWAKNAPRLPSRLDEFGIWFRKIAGHSTTVWWAVRQTGLHPDIREQIKWELERSDNAISPVVAKAWRYLFDYWDEERSETYRDWYRLSAEITKNGWDKISLRKYAAFAQPFLKVKPNSWGGVFPPRLNTDFSLTDLIALDVSYPDLPPNIEVPDEWRNVLIVELRRNLETALDLETEIGGHGLWINSPITADENTDGNHHGRNHGLFGWILHFARHFNRLLEKDVNAARSEFNKWPNDDDNIFARLKICATGKSELITDNEFGSTFDSISNAAFWNSGHSRDLLLTLSKRWNDLPLETTLKLGRRLIEGPSIWKNETKEKFIERKAWDTLNRINWLNEQGCKFTLDIEAVTSQLRKPIPDWKPEYAGAAARSFEGRSGWVRTETESSALLKEPIANTLTKAKELSGRLGMEFVEHDPFAGLSTERPVRSFAALRLAAKYGDFPEWAWSTFLNPKNRENDKPKLTAFIGEQITRYGTADVAGFVRTLTDWLQKSAKILAVQYPDLFSRLIVKATEILALEPQGSLSGIVRSNKTPDWTMEAINSPTGDIAEALFDDPQKNNLKASQGLPKKWLAHVEKLLALQGDLRRHALVIFSFNLSWFFYVDPKWTKANLLSLLHSENLEDRQSLWSGFLWSGNANGKQFFSILKPHMLELAKSNSVEKRGHSEVLTGLLLSAWAIKDKKTPKKWVPNNELRDLLLHAGDDFRCRVLWQVENWVREDHKRWLPLLIELINDVWPRQIAAKSGRVSARLCDLVFSNEADFPKLAKIVLPLLTKIDQDHFSMPNLCQPKNNSVDLHPRETLALLHAVLPDKVSSWPFNIESTISRIGEADSSLNNDERLIELRRRWDSR